MALQLYGISAIYKAREVVKQENRTALYFGQVTAWKELFLNQPPPNYQPSLMSTIMADARTMDEEGHLWSTPQ